MDAKRTRNPADRAVAPYVNADGSNSTAQGKLYMKFIAGGTGTFGIFLTIKTDGG